MAVNLTINGVSYSFPETSDENWGDNVTDWATAVSQGLLQKAGGTFTLTADVDFGTTFGVKSAYFKSRTANIATSGVVRLASTESLSWRNNANSGNLNLTTNSSDQLLFNGNAIAASGGAVPVGSGGTGITSYTTGDTLYASGTSTLSKLSIGASSTVVVSTGSAPSWALIANANIDTSAAITRTKLASGSASHVLINDTSGIISSEATLSPTRGGTGVSNNASATLTRSGNHALTITTTGTTSVTFPTSGTLATAPVVPTIQSFTTSSGTYTKPAGVLYLRVKMIAGGGGGAGGGSAGATGTTGSNTTFGSSFLTCNGGAGGVGNNGAGGAGGTATIGAGASGIALSGSSGGVGIVSPSTSGYGGNSPFYSGGANPGVAGAVGNNAVTNTGGGGSGGSASGGTNTGSGGGSGGFIEALITTVSATYAYSVGGGGGGGAGSGGSGPQTGGSGATGRIDVFEYYQ